MTFELTPDEDRTPEERAALAATKKKAEQDNTRTGCAVMLLFGVLLLGAGFGLKSCFSAATKPIPERVAAREAREVAISEGRDRDAVERDPENYITVDYQTDATGRISGKLINRSAFRIANVRVRCDQVGGSGKRLSRDSITITRVVPANGSVKFGPLFVAFLDQQAVRMDCGPTDGDVPY